MSDTRQSLEELIHRDDPAWPLVQEWIAKATRPVEVLPPSADAGASLVALQVTTRSPMGAIVLETGGILVDHGWIRILGSGHPRLPRSLPGWNAACGPGTSDMPPFLRVADDAIGGFFALNGGHFGPGGPNVWYFSPWKTTAAERCRYTRSTIFTWKTDPEPAPSLPTSGSPAARTARPRLRQTRGAPRHRTEALLR